MITSAKQYTKKTNKNGQTEPQDKWQNKAIQRKSHKEAYTYTLTKREKGKNIYIYKNRRRAAKSINKSTNDNKL